MHCFRNIFWIWIEIQLNVIFQSIIKLICNPKPQSRSIPQKKKLWEKSRNFSYFLSIPIIIFLFSPFWLDIIILYNTTCLPASSVSMTFAPSIKHISFKFSHFSRNFNLWMLYKFHGICNLQNSWDKYDEYEILSKMNANIVTHKAFSFKIYEHNCGSNKMFHGFSGNFLLLTENVFWYFFVSDDSAANFLMNESNLLVSSSLILFSFSFNFLFLFFCFSSRFYILFSFPFPSSFLSLSLSLYLSLFFSLFPSLSLFLSFTFLLLFFLLIISFSISFSITFSFLFLIFSSFLLLFYSFFYLSISFSSFSLLFYFFSFSFHIFILFFLFFFLFFYFLPLFFIFSFFSFSTFSIIVNLPPPNHHQ